MIQNLKKSLVLGALLTLGFAANSQAEEFTVGANIGYGSQLSSPSQGAVDFGAELTYHLDPMWSLGVNWNMIPFTSAQSLHFILAEFNYHMGEGMPLYMGLAAGVGLTTGTVSSTNFAFGAQAGYDLAIAPGLSIGPKVALDFVNVAGTSTTVLGIPVTTASQITTNLQALAAIKYHF